MVLTAVAKEETLNEEWHREASRRDRQGKELGGGPAVSSELTLLGPRPALRGRHARLVGRGAPECAAPGRVRALTYFVRDAATLSR